jgi:hypothetical protein
MKSNLILSVIDLEPTELSCRSNPSAEQPPTPPGCGGAGACIPRESILPEGMALSEGRRHGRVVPAS